MAGTVCPRFKNAYDASPLGNSVPTCVKQPSESPGGSHVRSISPPANDGAFATRTYSVSKSAGAASCVTTLSADHESAARSAGGGGGGPARTVMTTLSESAKPDGSGTE